jgi:hypothetical protein
MRGLKCKVLRLCKSITKEPGKYTYRRNRLEKFDKEKQASFITKLQKHQEQIITENRSFYFPEKKGKDRLKEAILARKFDLNGKSMLSRLDIHPYLSLTDKKLLKKVNKVSKLCEKLSQDEIDLVRGFF